MWDEVANALINFGFPGVALIAFGWYFVKSQAEHKKERDDWKKTSEDQFNKIAEVHKENATILTKIVTMLENRN